MAIKLFQTGGKFGVQQANQMMKGYACTELPDIADVDPNIPFFYIPDKTWRYSDGTQFQVIGIIPPAAVHHYSDHGIIDQNNDFEMMIETPTPIITAQIKLLGLQFPSFFYTDYPTRQGEFNTEYVNDGHTHSVSVSGTTGSNSYSHSHTVTNITQGGGGVNTSTDSNSHTHTFSATPTTSANAVQHRHSVTVTLTGSTVKTTFSHTLLQVFISTTRANWGTACPLDLSQLYSTDGTPYLDIQAYLTPGVINYIRFHLNTTNKVGGKISAIIKLN